VSEIRTIHDLGSVVDTDPEVVEQVADLLVASIDFHIPGFGIDNDPDQTMTHDEVHKHHKGIVTAAFRIIDPPVDIGYGFSEASKSDFLNGGDAHTDLVGHYPTITKQMMTLRLHTAGANGANVILANAGIGSIDDIGDRELFDESGIPCRKVISLGYDYDESEGLLADHRKFQLERDSYDPIYSEPDFYLHTQRPHCSVVFRSVTTMGPASVHKFRAVELDSARIVLASNLNVYGQL